MIRFLPSQQVGQKLARASGTPDDIDLWGGGLLEKAVEGGISWLPYRRSRADVDQFARFKHVRCSPLRVRC
ncbi:GL23869 [Drosophila persimilis]|uniref:GL23869 n=1 Tax=Drosophila persimilis TaxID=7234 RepID=B4ISJ1_DROPE|nr:GL23869 [Drosophila persimilis]